MTPSSLEGPITVGSISPPLDPRGVALEPVGYVEEEWFASGAAADYIAVKDFTEDGMWRGAEMKKTRPAVRVASPSAAVNCPTEPAELRWRSPRPSRG